MDDERIYAQVSALVAEEHELRGRRARGEIDAETEHERLDHLEQTLDQCWDLLRRRRARRAAGQDPQSAEPGSVAQVEHYLQ
ncbi:DUF2630 family protein [Candidatus Frankia alpina]|uniref:DUF2630 family protein n=1 Tax=Candidatus Frankia alpina TaxID=2699483 RepID=A0A4S5ESN6_9ACTN|nr:DUF2630 family protein [Candidatus Frankia alpina]THJ75416.1 DUF2630 family protein [Candidatus Frankia alpina]